MCIVRGKARGKGFCRFGSLEGNGLEMSSVNAGSLISKTAVLLKEYRSLQLMHNWLYGCPV